MYRTLGSILGENFADDIYLHESAPTLPNAPVFSLSVVDGNQSIIRELPEPVRFEFRQLVADNFSFPQCVYWRSVGSVGGEWSSEGCLLVDQYWIGDGRYVTCECSHLSTFTVLEAAVRAGRGPGIY